MLPLYKEGCTIGLLRMNSSCWDKILRFIFVCSGWRENAISWKGSGSVSSNLKSEPKAWAKIRLACWFNLFSFILPIFLITGVVCTLYGSNNWSADPGHHPGHNSVIQSTKNITRMLNLFLELIVRNQEGNSPHFQSFLGFILSESVCKAFTLSRIQIFMSKK